MNAIRLGATIKSYLIVRLASNAADPRNCQGKLDSSSLRQSQSVTGCNRLKLSIREMKYRNQRKIRLTQHGRQSVTNCHRLRRGPNPLRLRSTRPPATQSIECTRLSALNDDAFGAHALCAHSWHTVPVAHHGLDRCQQRHRPQLLRNTQ